VSERLFEHKEYIGRFGEDFPEVRDWRWGAGVRAES
jgi:phosphoketolase